MKKKPKLSVIIPCYNVSNYLEECLNSVVNQSYNDLEVICVNDGSTDNTLQIIKNFQKKYNFIKLIDKENGGVISARIAGYNAANGTYIGWVDADDFIDEEMYEIMQNKALTENADVVYCNYNFYPNAVINKQKWFKNYDGEVTWKFIMNNTIQWNKIVRKDLLDSLNITELFESIGEGCYGLVFINAKKIVSIDQCLYNYRVGHSSLSSNFNNIGWYKTVVERSLNMLNYVVNKKYDNQWIEYYKYRYLYYNLILMMVTAYKNDKDTYVKSRKKINKEKLFSNIYREYFYESFSNLKYLFLKYIGSNSFLLMRIATRILLK